MGHFEILEHTADVGVFARGESLEEVFEQATNGVASIAGVLVDEPAQDRVRIEVEGRDEGALLVDWLNEVLYLYDSRDALVAGVKVEAVGGGRAVGEIALCDRAGRAVEGTQVKAVTLHQLLVERAPDGWTARVFVDV